MLKMLKMMLLLSWIAAVPYADVYAQSTVATGIVRNDKGEPLPGVSVQEKGISGNGTATDENGAFRLALKGTSRVLIFSYVGFLKQELSVTDAAMKITLQQDDKQLNDVVVIGYQQVSRRNVAAAVSTIKAKDIANIPLPSIDMMLQGKAAGVNIQVFSGEPGTAPTFVVRGNTAISRDDQIFNASSTPLIVIDGVPQDASEFARYNTAPGANFLAGLNPNDVETIDILKDASAAAIYGSRGANGVVLITTKKGKTGKPKVSLNAYAGVTQSPRLPEIFLGAAERREKINQIYNNGDYWQIKENPLMLTDSLNPAFNNNTDWFGLLYRPGLVQNYDLSAAGGTDYSNYRISLGYYDEKGTLRGTGFKRYSINANYNTRFGEKVTLTTNIRYTQAARNPLTESRQRNITGIDPNNFPSSLFYMSEDQKQIYLGQFSQSKDENTDDNLVLTGLLNYKITPWLQFTSNLSFTNQSSRRDIFNPSTSNSSGVASASSASNRANSYLVSNYFNFNKKIGRSHELAATVGNEYNYNKFAGTNVSGTNIPTDQIQVVQGIRQQDLSGYSSYGANALLSYFTRLSWTIKDRYSLSLAWRADGSSRFGKDRRWGYFPSASAYWILSDENFMSGLSNKVQLLKLRASYGINGRNVGDDYGAYNRYRVNGGFPGSDGSPVSYNGTTAITPNFGDGIAQDKLTWEEARQWDFGLDLELYKGRVNFYADIYNRENHGIRFDFPLAVTSGYERYYTNAASIRNAGLELMLQTRNLAPNRAVQWTTTVTAAFNKNTVIKLPDNNKGFTQGQWILEVGKPLYQYYMYEYEGVYMNADEIPVNPLTGRVITNVWGNPFKVGDAKYRDLDGNYQWNHFSFDDRSQVGDPNPKWIGGFINEVNYRNWGLRVQTSFTLNRDIYNESMAQVLQKINDPGGANELGRGFSSMYGPGESFYMPEDYVARRALINTAGQDFWNKNKNYAGSRPKLPSNSIYAMQYNFTEFNTMYLENGSYFKINNVLLSYSLPPSILRRLKLERLRVYGVLDNVWIFKAKDTQIPDPENVDPYGFYRGGMYGITRRATFGVDLGF